MITFIKPSLQELAVLKQKDLLGKSHYVILANKYKDCGGGSLKDIVRRGVEVYFADMLGMDEDEYYFIGHHSKDNRPLLRFIVVQSDFNELARFYQTSFNTDKPVLKGDVVDTFNTNRIPDGIKAKAHQLYDIPKHWKAEDDVLNYVFSKI